MRDDAKAVQRTVRGFQEKLAAHEAQALAARAERIGDTLLIAEALEGWDPQGLKAIAVAAAAAQPEAVVALFTASTPAQVVIARGPKSTTDAGAMLKRLAEKFGGKGGGKPDLAQGGGLGAPSTDLIAYVKKIL
jgi:alanyl-tRNA synthetase